MSKAEYQLNYRNPHPNFVDCDKFPVDDPLSFYMDCGSIFAWSFDWDKFYEPIRWLEANARHEWHWTDQEFTIFQPDPKGLLVPGSGTEERLSVVDLRRYVWINFDSKDDAMLTRITLDGLRSGKDVERGRLSRRT